MQQVVINQQKAMSVLFPGMETISSLCVISEKNYFEGGKVD